MPRNSPTGFVCAFFATIMGFALIWHIWWMVILGGIGAFATFVVFAWRDHDEYVIPADEVARDRPRQRRGAAQPRQRRGDGLMSMTATAGCAHADPASSSAAAHVEHPGPAPKRIVTGYGFWIFLLSDIVMFSCFFAAYAVLSSRPPAARAGARCSSRNVAIETACLLLSSFTCGMASIAADVRNRFWF